MKAGELGATLLGILIFGVQVLFLASATGIVKEHCLASDAENIQQVESGWTYILWPPLVFTALDPPGRCVRNTIARETLGKVGIWPLGTPSEQVEAHLRNQAEREGSEDLISLIETGTGKAEDEKELLLKKFKALSRQLGYPAEVERCVSRAIRRLPADQLYDEARGELNQRRIANVTEKAWSRCLPEGTPTIDPNAPDKAVEMNRWLIAEAATENLREANAPEEMIDCVEQAIYGIERNKLIELSAEPRRVTAHVDSLVRGCVE